jgi:hypothetical protein
MSNQLMAVLRIYEQFNSHEMGDALSYCLFELPQLTHDKIARESSRESDYDRRLWLLAAFYTEIGALVVDGFLDERLIHRLMPTMARAWAVVSPIAMILREQRTEPIWAEFEYIAELYRRRSPSIHLKRYPKWFLSGGLSRSGGPLSTP